MNYWVTDYSLNQKWLTEIVKLEIKRKGIVQGITDDEQGWHETNINAWLNGDYSGSSLKDWIKFFENAPGARK